MYTRVAIRKTEYRASCGRVFYTRRPIRLQNKTFATRGHVFEVSVEKFLRGNAEFLCLFHLFVRKFVLKPRKHPVSAINLHFGIILAGEHCGIRGHERLCFDVFIRSHLHRCGSPERKRSTRAVHATRPQSFAPLVRARRDNGQTLLYAEIVACLFGDISDNRARFDKITHILCFQVEYRCGYRVRTLPRFCLVVKGNMPYLVCHRVFHNSGQSIGYISRKHQEFVHFCPYFRLVLVHPVARRRLALRCRHIVHIDESEQ